MVTPLAGPIGRGPAQQLAQRELAKPEYQQHQTFLGWLAHQFDRLFNAANGSVPGGWWAIVAVIALVLIGLAIVRAGAGPVARTRRGAGEALLETLLTAQEHRDLAARLAADGDYSGAITEALRAIAAGLEQRGILAPDRGRTAGEFAAQAGQALTGQAAALAAAARLFDDVRYGGRAGTQAGYAQLTALDQSISAAKPALAGHRS